MADMLLRTGELTLRLEIKSLLPLVVAVILPGCATQSINSSSASGPSAQATISAESKVWAFSFLPGSFIAVTINSVDGQKVGSGNSKVSVDPGAHKVSVTCHAVGAENTEEISVNAVSGAHYQLSALVGGNRSLPCTSIVEQKSEGSQ
jgi:hypothetical protein